MNKQLTDEQRQEFEDKLTYSEEQNLVIEIGLSYELPNLQQQNGDWKGEVKMARTRIINAGKMRSSSFIEVD